MASVEFSTLFKISLQEMLYVCRAKELPYPNTYDNIDYRLYVCCVLIRG